MKLTIQQQVKLLHLHGHFGSIPYGDVVGLEDNHKLTLDAVERFQKENGLERDRVYGPVTESLLSRPTCGVNEQARGQLCQWPKNCNNSEDYTTITISFDPRGVRGISEDKAVELAEKAAKAWSDVSGIHLKFVESGAQLVGSMGSIGRGVLGLAQLPCGIRCGDSLWWKLQITTQWNEETFLEVGTHEIGHSEGHDHHNGKSIMTTHALGDYLKPTAYDIAQAVKRYGKDGLAPTPEPPVDPDPPATDDLEVVYAKLFEYNSDDEVVRKRSFFVDDIWTPPTL